MTLFLLGQLYIPGRKLLEEMSWKQCTYISGGEIWIEGEISEVSEETLLLLVWSAMVVGPSLLFNSGDKDIWLTWGIWEEERAWNIFLT